LNASIRGERRCGGRISQRNESDITGGGGKIIVSGADQLGLIESYIATNKITRAKAAVVGATVEITDKCGELKGDLDDNCQVDLQDFMLLAKDWLKDATP
jgi:hypothetical protein